MFECSLVLTVNGLLKVLKPISNTYLDMVANPLRIKENDLVRIEVTVSGDHYPPKLWLQDLELSSYSNNKTLDGGIKQYIWSEEKWFINHFGYCQLSLLFQNLNEKKNIIFPYIEILASKLNAECTSEMLKYLEKRVEDVVSTCFSLTHQNKGIHKPGSNHPNYIIEETRKCLETIERLLPIVLKRPVSRLEPYCKIVPIAQVKSISEKSLTWLCSHADLMEPSDWRTARSYKIKNRYFTFQEVLEESLVENTDIYENRVLMGLLSSVKIILNQIKDFYAAHEKRFRNFYKTYEKPSIPPNYQRFENIAAQFGFPYCQRKVQQCYDLLKKANQITKMLESRMNINPIIGMPKLTPKFQSYPHYRSIFEMAVRWYRLGSLNLVGDSFLFALKSLDLLYEVYCLFRLIESLKILEYSKVFSSKFPSEIEEFKSMLCPAPDRYYRFIGPEGEVVHLWYEPDIGRSKSDIKDLVRIYGEVPLKPDYVIGFEFKNINMYAVLDAKYSNTVITEEINIPKLTFKYLHQIGSTEGGFSPVMFLWAICPDLHEFSSGIPQYLLKRQKNKPIPIPNLGILTVTPGKEDKMAFLLHEIFTELKRLITVIRYSG